MKKTAVAPSNIAFIKYWGKKDEDLKIPENGSISMNLSNLLTTTTVEFNKYLREDEIIINGEKEERESGEVIRHLDRVRKLAKTNCKAKVVSKNNFPKATGLSSSASGFAALTLAASKASNLNLSEKELSILARQGSGSACRSIPDGFVEWLAGNTNNSYAVSIFPHDYWDIVDVVAVVSKNKKEIPTTEGQRFAKTSPFLRDRLQRIKEKIKLIKQYMQEKNFSKFGELIEQEALELHSIMLTSMPPLIYWSPETIKVIHEVFRWRHEGIEVYFTFNTGQNVHLICQKKDARLVSKKISGLSDAQKIIVNIPSVGVRITRKHLF